MAVFGLSSSASARSNISKTITIGNIAPAGLTTLFSKDSNTKFVLTKTILDLMFRDCCVIMQTPSLIFTSMKSLESGSTGVGVGIGSNLIDKTGFPLLGFQFQQPKKLELLKYSYSEYPFLNRNVVANAMQKELTTVTLQGLRPVIAGNPVLVNYVVNTLGLNLYIEKYCDFGGLWNINTMWGLRRNYVLESLNGTLPVGEVGGVGWEFTFKRLNFDSTTMSQSVARASSKVAILGGA